MKPTSIRLALLALLAAAVSTRTLAAQTLPAGPLSALDGRLTLGAELVATIGEQDHSAYFNFTDYEHNALRTFRASLTAMWRPLDRLAFVADVRTDDFGDVRASAAYVRVRPFRSRQLDIQAGRVPPVFGSFARQAYTLDNPVIGYPLAYQYLTSLRADAVPATAEDLVEMRARGWRAEYRLGSPEPGPGLPLASAFRWDTGVQARWREGVFEIAAAFTNGSLGDPRVRDNNNGKQLAARIAVAPVTGLAIGGSLARGRWLDRRVQRLLGEPGSSSDQSALGADLEYSRDHWLIRSELVWSRWELPLAGSGTQDLGALAAWIEGRYRLTPRLFVGARFDRLGFSDIASGGASIDWEAPVRRVELAAGYYLQRNLVLRAAVQHNRRDGGRVLRRTYIAGQASFWF